MPRKAHIFGISMVLNASVERLWPYLSDTDRTNRLLGLPASEQAITTPDYRRNISGHFMGLPVQWHETPFEWMFERFFEVARHFDAPFPIASLITRTSLHAIDAEHTRVDVEVRLRQRNPRGGHPAKLFPQHVFLRDMRRLYQQLAVLAVTGPEYIVLPAEKPPELNQASLRHALGRIGEFGIAPGLIEKISQFVQTADDPDVIKMRPFVLADRWQEPRMDVLRAFLYGTRVGLFELEWDIICPNCRGISERIQGLDSLKPESHCPSCLIRYDVDFEESVELRFSINADIREAQDMTYCVGGPATTRHIRCQLWLQPEEQRQIMLRLDQGSYRLRVWQLPISTTFEVTPAADAQPSLSLTLTQQDIQRSAARIQEQEEVAIGLHNATEQALLFAIEQSAWTSQAASAALVTSLEEFRQLFSSEVLAPGMDVSIRSLTFLFSDLKDSTQIYDNIGDSPAYARVRDHFTILRGIIAQHNGALIKTIGDAVMAVFRSSDDALRAALAIQQDFKNGPIARSNPQLSVKLGMHAGPCIAVNANGVLDYFGSTVNIAARVQSESVGGDIVLTDTIMQAPGTAIILSGITYAQEQFERDLKGISRRFTLFRVLPQILTVDNY